MDFLDAIFVIINFTNNTSVIPIESVLEEIRTEKQPALKPCSVISMSRDWGIYVGRAKMMIFEVMIRWLDAGGVPDPGEK